MQFEQPLHEFVRMAKGVKAAVADRNNALHDLHHAQDEVAAKKTKLTKLKSESGWGWWRLCHCGSFCLVLVFVQNILGG